MKRRHFLQSLVVPLLPVPELWTPPPCSMAVRIIPILQESRMLKTRFTSLSLIGTVSGRLSSSESNFSNIPRPETT